MGKEQSNEERLGIVEMEKIKILYAMGGVMHRAGAETVIMRYIRELLKMNKFDISILVHGNQKADYDDELVSYGISIYHMPVRGQHIFTYNRTLNKFFSEHSFDIVHCNMDTACGDFLEIAKKHNVKVRIAHSHSTSYQTHNFMKKFNSYLSKIKIPKVATDLIACSQLSGEWTYRGSKFMVLNNALDSGAYMPNKDVRKKIRNELNIPLETKVIGHVGRFSFVKNHILLLKIFDKYHAKNKKSILVCVGDGEERENIEQLASELKIKDNVRFLGVRNDVEHIMQAFDVFVLPSIFEGLPLVGIEAQAAGLPCVFANTITDEVCIGDKCVRLPLNDTDLWCGTIEKLANEKVDYEYNRKALTKHGYDIKTEAKKLADYYFKLIER